MTRATRAIINLSALRHNLSIARRRAPDSRIMAIIKANGYGHGSVTVAQALNEVDAFGVACLDEAITLREAGIAQPIVLLEGAVHAADLNLVRGYQLELVVHHPAQINLLEQDSGRAIPVWLKLDTGMHRLGIPPGQVAEMLQRLGQLETVAQPVRLMTHLANADDRQDNTTSQQLARFDAATADLKLQTSIANSAGILAWPDTHRDWVRPGIMLYGVSPFVDSAAAENELQPVMTLQSELIAVNRQQQGDPIGYGGTYRCPADMPVGVIAIGYGDGYPRHAPTGTPVLVNGKRVPLIGRVSMDMICVDLRDCPEAQIGDPVVLWGDDLPVEEIASQAGTIGYELLCQVTQRVPFDYQHGIN
ncbi:MAG: alanine racemase [Gammaproteobacteria bacterium]|nr:alanine racemase [Gammaproteobacteria bacterium]